MVYPNLANKDLEKSFIRGLFDGSGFIKIQKDAIKPTHFSIVLNNDLFDKVKSFIKSELNMDVGEEKSKTNPLTTKIMKIRGFDKVKNLLSFFYEKSDFIPQKHKEKYDEFMKLFKKYNENSQVLRKKIA